MRSIAAFLLLAALLPVAPTAFAPRAGAQTAPGVPAILEGSYSYPRGSEHGRSTVMAALEPMITMLPYFTQGLVRARILERLALPHRISVALSDDTTSDVAVTYEGDRVITVASPLDGSTTVTTSSGRVVPVTQTLHFGWLEQNFTGENGTLTVLLSTEPDGRTLHVDGTMRGERLAAPVAVRLDYTRAP